LSNAAGAIPIRDAVHPGWQPVGPVEWRTKVKAKQPEQPDKKEAIQWESVHLCPKCGHALNLEETDLEAVTTGIATCPKCEWAAPINLKIVQEEKPGE
jgi:ssDNA-binding Zn-finger/Zn-ribbon topoisomerase 1